MVSPAETGSDPLAWTLNEAATALARRTITSEELTKLCLARVGKLDHQLNSFITLDADSAWNQARECDRRRKAGRVLSTLDGIPIALKDNIDTAGVRTTAAAQVFRDRIPAEDAEVTRRLKTAGLVCLGKLNLDEMAFAGTWTTGCFGPVHNPGIRIESRAVPRLAPPRPFPLVSASRQSAVTMVARFASQARTAAWWDSRPRTAA